MAETPYVETEALLAVLQADLDRCEELLAGLLPGELRAFDRQVELLGDLISRRLRAVAVDKVADALRVSTGGERGRA